MANQLVFHLNDSGYTNYHRAALGGLASTVFAWQNEGLKGPDGIQYEFDEQRVSIGWGDELEDTEAIQRILDASFRITEDTKLIDLPGLGLRPNQDGLRVAVHNVIMGTFLQHNQMRSTEKDLHIINVTVDESDVQLLSYKGLLRYVHQDAKKMKLISKTGKLAELANIPQTVIPGATAGASGLETSGKDVFILLYVMVGCPVYLLRSRTHQEKTQYGIVVPNVTNLVDYNYTIRRLAQLSPISGTHTDYDRRIAGGAEEAGLRFLTDLTLGTELFSDSGVDGCTVITMGKVAWDANQINRSSAFRIGTHYKEIDIFIASSSSVLGGVKKIKGKNDLVFAVPASPVPALVAANLANGNHWCNGLAEIINEQKQFNQFLFLKGGFQQMKKAIRNKEDLIIVDAFHEAWRRTMGQLGERARREGLDFLRLLEVEQEKMRNTILRLKTSEALANWFLRFCVSGTGGGTLPSFQKNKAAIHEFITNRRNYERFQNLCLFALLSYANEDHVQSEEGAI